MELGCLRGEAIKLQRRPYVAILNGSLSLDLGARGLYAQGQDYNRLAWIGEYFVAKQDVCLRNSYKHSKDNWVVDDFGAREVFQS